MAEAIEAASKSRGCPDCGNLYIGSAFTVHRDDGRCLRGDCYGQLELVDGAWVMRGSGTAGR